MNKLVYILLIAICWSCSENSDTEKHQKERNNTIHVREKVKEIDIQDILVSRSSQITLLNEFLIIGDYEGYDELIHIFDKNNFNHLASTGSKGPGPGEITIPGHIATDPLNRRFFISDHGKQKVFSYEIDSVLANPYYMPQEKLKMNVAIFPSEYIYIDDTLCIGRIIQPIGTNDYKPSVGKWNMNTGEIKRLPYEHPKIEKKRTTSTASIEHNIYVEFYSYHDLITICNLDGELQYNIYGKNWQSKKTNETTYFGQGVICKDKIIVPYSGKPTLPTKQNSLNTGNHPTQLMVFDLNGDYLKTLETTYQLTALCYDKEKNQLFMILDDDIQFGYLDLEGLI